MLFRSAQEWQKKYQKCIIVFHCLLEFHVFNTVHLIINSVEDFVKDLELYACNDTTQENFNKLLLEKDESLVYACLSLRPKSMEELLKKTGFAMPQMADILQRLIQKDFITESFKNYYIRKI